MYLHVCTWVTSEVEVTFATVFLLVEWFAIYTGYGTEKTMLYRKTLLTQVEKTLAVPCLIL